MKKKIWKNKFEKLVEVIFPSTHGPHCGLPPTRYFDWYQLVIPIRNFFLRLFVHFLLNRSPRGYWNRMFITKQKYCKNVLMILQKWWYVTLEVVVQLILCAQSICNRSRFHCVITVRKFKTGCWDSNPRGLNFKLLEWCSDHHWAIAVSILMACRTDHTKYFQSGLPSHQCICACTNPDGAIPLYAKPRSRRVFCRFFEFLSSSMSFMYAWKLDGLTLFHVLSIQSRRFL